MKFAGITTPSWFSLCSLSSVFFLALAGPTLADPHGNSSYSSKHHGMVGSPHMQASVHGDQHHSKGYPGMGDSHHDMGSAHGEGHSEMGHGGKGATHPGTHQDAIEFIDHILKFKEGMSLTDDQEKKLRAIKTNYQKDRIKMKAAVALANIDLHELLRDSNASLADIERNLKKVYGLKADLNMASIKAKRDAKAVLTAEQQARMDKIHERIKSHGANPAHASGYSRAGKEKGGY